MINLIDRRPSPTARFTDPVTTAKGEARARVHLEKLQTLWLNTGTLCNIQCANCYILSSPKNDDLIYLGLSEAERFLDEAMDLGTREIGLTGGEPFMNPDCPAIIEAALTRGFEVLVLTNAMRPMMRTRVQDRLLDVQSRFGAKLTMRISLDHHDRASHDEERGAGSFDETLKGMVWLRDAGVAMAVAGRTRWEETEDEMRAGYRRLYDRLGLSIDADDPSVTVLFPEMDESGSPPEITTGCWSILGVSPSDMMCASSRMVVHHKGDARASVQACTLLAYDRRFQLGETLAQAETSVALNHPHCATFCVLGGGSCSG